MSFDFETNATAIDYGYGVNYKEGHAVLAGAELHIKTAPCIIEGLHGLVDSGYFNWTPSTDERYLEAIVKWMKEVRHFEINKEWLVPSYGIMQAIACTMRAFTKPGDGVILQPPVYVLYHRAIPNCGRVIVNNPLILEGDHYKIDFNDLEEKMSDPRNKMMILCNPHNPIMDFWEEEDLKRIATLAAKHNVIVIADEIFAEHVYEKEAYVSYGTIDGARVNSIVCTSIGKAFNFTGTSHANVIIQDEAIRSAYITQRNEDHYGSLSPFMRTAVLSAYSEEGKQWLAALEEFVHENARYVRAFFETNFPEVKILRHRAGALMWLDLRAFKMSEDALAVLFEKAHITADFGSKYGVEGSGFIRLLIGVPKQELISALERFKKVAEEQGIIS
jgi:cystathionine beta-lyase